MSLFIQVTCSGTSISDVKLEEVQVGLSLNRHPVSIPEQL
jgi:hypothetical protein